jgi:hypothetical protein
MLNTRAMEPNATLDHHAGTPLPAASPLRFPGEDGGHSLAEMAQRDLDAALQLLADRAQYITGASGAAIALCRSGKPHLLCRASTGSNAPELGALLSTEFGLSGECARTRQPLRCDDAQRDARVNHDACRQMGIGSVVVMPVVQDDKVLGVFELFSGRAHAFGERDLSALERLSQMVETAVRLAHAAEQVPEQLQAAQPVPKVAAPEISPPHEPAPEVKTEPAPELPATIAAPVPSAPPQAPAQPHLSAPAEPAPPQRPLFWSAPPNLSPDAQAPTQPDQSHVPPVLRKLRQCEACGFPISAGRTLCVECEEKRWRGQLRSSPQTAPRPVSSTKKDSAPGARAFAAAAQSPAPPLPGPRPAATSQTVATASKPPVLPKTQENATPRVAADPLPPEAPAEPAPTPQTPATELVLSAGLEPAQSWFAANKYILGALLVVAAVVAAIFLLR